MRKTIREAQQELAQNCGYGSEVIWDLLTADDAAVMKSKIKQLIPDQEENQNALQTLRNTIFERVWDQRKYTNKTSISYIFYVMVTKEQNFNVAPNSTEFSCHPVFRCKKCDDNSGTSNCCMIYVDETGRVYQNWESFIAENILPAGTMVAPRKGIYNFERDQVILEIYCTPNGTSGANALSIVETGSAVAGIGASVVSIAALAMPVAAPIVAAAGLIGLGVGAFTSVTSVLNLNDRKKHEQSISVRDSQARASYFGIVGGAVGIAAAGATRVLTSMAAAGKATVGVEVFVNGMNITSIALSGSGTVNSALDLIFKRIDGDKISSLEILQLSASLVLFTHSIYNFQLASHIANNARTDSIKSYRETLSNRQRKMFDKMSKETVRIRGNSQGKMDIIRSLIEIPDRQFLNDLYKINKQLNQRDVRPAFGGANSNIVLNNELPVASSALRQSVQHQQGPNILDQVTQPIPSTYNSETYTTETPKAARLLYSTENIVRNVDINRLLLNDINDQNQNGISILGSLIMVLPNGGKIFLREFGNRLIENIGDINKFQEVIFSMCNNLPENIIKFLMELTQNFIENLLNEIQQTIKIYIPTESILYRMLKNFLENYRCISSCYILQKGPDIVNAVKNYYLSFTSRNPNILAKKCPDCPGRFSICVL